MESAVVRHGGLRAKDFPEIAALYEHPGPFITCYLQTHASQENAQHQLTSAWRDVAYRLGEQGADDRSIEAIEAALEGAQHLGETLAVVAAAGRVLLIDGDDEASGIHDARIAALPRIGPLLAWRQKRMGVITVACDRAGADISVAAQHTEYATSAGDPDRHSPLLHKAQSGGWSQRHHQQRIDNAWEHNAKDVTDLLDRLVAEVRPRLVLYGGDPKACSLFENYAGTEVRRLMRQVNLSRSADGGDDRQADAVRNVVRLVETEDTSALLSGLEDPLGMTGSSAVLEALSAARVDVLLACDDWNDERSAFFSLDPPVVGLAAPYVQAMGAQPRRAPLVDAAIAVAFATGASVRILPPGTLEEGVGALLRHT